MNVRQYLSRREAAEYINGMGLRISHNTLAKYACLGGGPEMRTFGRRVFYELPGLLDWVASRMSRGRASTSTPDDS